MLAIEADSKTNRTKIAILLSAIRPDALERYNHFKSDDSPNDPPNTDLPHDTDYLYLIRILAVFKVIRLYFVLIRILTNFMEKLF